MQSSRRQDVGSFGIDLDTIEMSEYSRRDSNPSLNMSAHTAHTHDYGIGSKDDMNEPLVRPSDAFSSRTTTSGYAKLPHGKQAGASTLDPGGSKRRRSMAQVLRSWWAEIAWSLLATGLLICLIGLLGAYNEKPVPEWASDVSLNTAVAVIATVCRASMVIPVSEGLSQLKWNAFAQSQRPLVDLYIFDQASRGPLGSLILLSKTRGRLLGVSTLAALILISGLATSPLTQATILLAPPPKVISDDARMERSSVVTLDDLVWLQLPLRNAISRAFFIGDRERENLELLPTCPSSECHWEPFRSVDVCFVEKNITNKLVTQLKDPNNLGDFDLVQEDVPINTTHKEYWNVTLDEDLSMRFEIHDLNYYSWVFATGGRQKAEAKALWGDDANKFPETTFATQIFIYKSVSSQVPPEFISYQGSNSPYRAVALSWYWCIKEYEIEVAKGVPHVKATETNFNVTETTETEGNVTTENYIMTDTNTTKDFPVPLRTWTDEVVRMKTEPFGRENNAIMIQVASQIIGNVTGKVSPWDNIKTWGADAALGMSAAVRSYDGKNAVKGLAEVGPFIVIIRWQWLSLLVVQIVLMIAFMIYVIYETEKTNVKVVKGSNIAELKASKSLDRASRDESGSLLAGGIAPKVDPDLVGRLVEHDGHWNLENLLSATVQHGKMELCETLCEPYVYGNEFAEDQSVDELSAEHDTPDRRLIARWLRICPCGNRNMYAFVREAEDDPYYSEMRSTKNNLLITDGAQKTPYPF
ncbi:hypothetical protein F66182_9972 [Fusarium sp. NRRL 66182]|nr:hypothetical protein F66182_9972 [Fusarium sp. NRRL 66182]